MAPININSFIVCYCFGYCLQGGASPFLRHSLHSSFMEHWEHLSCSFIFSKCLITNNVITINNKYVISVLINEGIYSLDEPHQLLPSY